MAEIEKVLETERKCNALFKSRLEVRAEELAEASAALDLRTSLVTIAERDFGSRLQRILGDQYKL